jgi:hypothetical protein
MRVGREPIKFFPKAMQGNECTAPTQLGFPEYKSKYGNKQIQTGDPQSLGSGITYQGFHALQDGGRVVLIAGRIISEVGGERFFVNVTADLENARKFGREIIQHLGTHLFLRSPSMSGSPDDR